MGGLRCFGARNRCRCRPLCRTTLVKETTASLALGAAVTTASMMTVIGTVAHASNATSAATDALAAAVAAACTEHVRPSCGQLVLVSSCFPVVGSHVIFGIQQDARLHSLGHLLMQELTVIGTKGNQKKKKK